MIGCQYCGMKENGDIPSELEMLMRVRPSFEAMDEGYEVRISDFWHDSMSMNLGVYNGKLVLFIGQVSEVVRKINYCPMCGRKF